MEKAHLVEKQTYRNEFKNRLKLLICEKAKDSIPEFADMIGESKNTVANWTEYESSVPSSLKIKQICDKTDTSADWLVCGKGTMDNVHVSRYDYVFRLWIDLWKRDPDFCDSEIQELSKIIYKKQIDDRIGSAGNNDTKAVSLINKTFSDWCQCLERLLRNYRTIEGLTKRIYIYVDGYPVRKSSEQDGRIVFEKLNEKEKKDVEFLETEAYSLFQTMQGHERDISTLLKLFKED
jgi:hypothetical protein